MVEPHGTYTITTELVVVLLGMIAVVVPGAYWMGRFANRLDNVEARVAKIDLAIAAFRSELLNEIRHLMGKPHGGT